MLRTRIVCLAFGSMIACGGSDGTVGDAGLFETGMQDGTTGMDGGGDGMMMTSCDAGQTACNGVCVDTSSDPMNCGGCGSICNTKCTNGICQLINPMGCDGGVGGVGDNACITIDSMNVYWASGLANGSIWRLPLGGGCPGLVVSGQPVPHGVASDGTNVFFGNQGNNGSIVRVPIGGGQTTTIASTQPNPLDVVVDATNVYWTHVARSMNSINPVC